MQQHFNDTYLESEKFPKCLFYGKIDKASLKEGENSVTVTGEIELHGVKKEISVSGNLLKDGDEIEATAVFYLLLKDFGIKIPKAVFYNIAEEIEVTINFTYEKI